MAWKYNRGWSNSLGPYTDLAGPEEAPDSQLWLLVTIWAAVQQMDDLFLTFSLSVTSSSKTNTIFTKKDPGWTHPCLCTSLLTLQCLPCQGLYAAQPACLHANGSISPSPSLHLKVNISVSLKEFLFHFLNLLGPSPVFSLLLYSLTSLSAG